MADLPDHRTPLGEVEFPDEVRDALRQVSELPDDLDRQAEFFERIQSSLAARLRDDET